MTSTLVIKATNDSEEVEVSGSLKVLRKVKIKSLIELLVNESKPWSILTEDFQLAPGLSCRQVYIRKMAERLQLHLYCGQVMH